MADYTLCTTKEDVAAALDALAGASHVFLDCEGRGLGNADGALSLIQLGAPCSERIFLIDALAVPHSALQRLFNDLLTCAEPRKVLWDGRMDDAELFFGYSCALTGVLDLQLVDVLSRAARGEGEERRIRRLARWDFPMNELRRLQLEGVHALSSMDGAAREHGVQGMAPKDASVKKMHADNGTQAWMARPLTPELLAYAAADIARLAAIYDRFFECGYLKDGARLCALSARYVTMHRATGRPERANIFLRGPYLPLCALPPDREGSSATAETLTHKECVNCKRTMLLEHFPRVQRAVAGASTGNEAPRTEVCKICTLVEARKRYAGGRDLLAGRGQAGAKERKGMDMDMKNVSRQMNALLRSGGPLAQVHISQAANGKWKAYFRRASFLPHSAGSRTSALKRE